MVPSVGHVFQDVLLSMVVVTVIPNELFSLSLPSNYLYACLQENLNYPKKIKYIEKKQQLFFTIASQRIKYTGINLTKEITNVYSENYKI